VIAHDIELNIRHLERRIAALERAALDLVNSVPGLKEKLDRLISVKGIGKTAGLKLLAELAALPPDIKAEQWVAHAGLDPRPYESGTSINKPRRITKAGNRYLRAALYMPALVAIQTQANVKAFYEKLIGRGKRPMQAIVAVMRKLLLCIWGMFRQEQNFDVEKFFKLP
jgi:transposase